MLKADSKVYTLGDLIGTTHCVVYDASVLRDAIKSSKVPLVKSFDRMQNTENIVGHADLEVTDNSIIAHLVFNESYSDILEDAIAHGYKPRTGFYANRVLCDKDVVNSMSIRCIGINETCLGGDIYNMTEEIPEKGGKK